MCVCLPIAWETPPKVRWSVLPPALLYERTVGQQTTDGDPPGVSESLTHTLVHTVPLAHAYMYTQMCTNTGAHHHDRGRGAEAPGQKAQDTALGKCWASFLTPRRGPGCGNRGAGTVENPWRLKMQYKGWKLEARKWPGKENAEKETE